MEICSENKCTGCAACVNICPRQCISLTENEYGELHPSVDETKCINCNLCAKTCPNNVPVVFNYPSHCYASWITDTDKRSLCASGGIGTIMAEYAIRHKHGVVFGTAYDDNFIPRVTYTETIEGLEAFKGSKYVQSIISPDTFKQVKDFLRNGRFVLYVGTPCQIAGLKTFLRKDYDNLITIDLICHGVCPTKYFKEEVDYLVNKHQIEGLSDVRFRGNDGNNFALTLWDKVIGNKRDNNYVLTLW